MLCVRFYVMMKGGVFISQRILNYNGRKKITASTRAEDLTVESIKGILWEVLPLHIMNSQDINYLNDVYRGKQDIYEKEKKYRPDINNQFVENHLMHCVKFKTGYVFDGVQYVQIVNDVDDKEVEQDNEQMKDISLLNKYFRNTHKQSVTNEVGKQCYIGGVSPIMVTLNPDNKEKPFELTNINPTQAFVVYSSGFKGERLFSVEMYTEKDYVLNVTKLIFKVTTTKNVFKYSIPYELYYGWRKDKNFAQDAITYVVVNDPLEEVNVRKEIPIFEYTLNKERMSIVEVGLDAQNALNKLTSSNIDDLEQYVQSLTVGIDVAIDEDVWDKATSQGLLLLKTTQDKRGSLEMLSQKLDYTAVQSTYENIMNRMYTILGVPLLNIGGGGGDTGQARLTDNGWLMADTKAREDEVGFVNSEQYLLDYILRYLREKDLIGELRPYDVEIKFNRNKVDNIQSMAQSYSMLVKSGIHPAIAMEVIGVFGDSNEVWQRSEKFFGKDFYLGEFGLKQKEMETISNNPIEEVEVREEI